MSNNIEEKIQQEREAARAACDINGAESGACAAAWDVVEELQAEAAHQRQKAPKKNAFEQYCDANPDADECRVYED
ncbi:Calvin cycle protein CP12 [Allocoleopsis franciscana]|uniref:CP12 domain protein n=1 Tax=Allocoleopsis franciscana PCC 7113 TaxID=1173027 RepID=K9WCW4_9CYAN|nr:Calvin cycle protein CP12 [Allocoleopsis franciscana]AFZ18245.1 CP12 domain protein [Allocoleopsis franciscana PCC 7113]